MIKGNVCCRRTVLKTNQVLVSLLSKILLNCAIFLCAETKIRSLKKISSQLLSLCRRVTTSTLMASILVFTRLDVLLTFDPLEKLCCYLASTFSDAKTKTAFSKRRKGDIIVCFISFLLFFSFCPLLGKATCDWHKQGVRESNGCTTPTTTQITVRACLHLLFQIVEHLNTSM